MQKFSQLLQYYQTYHTKPATFYTHLIGVPLVVFSVMIFFAWIHISINLLFDIELVWPLVIAAGIYYVWLNWRLGICILMIFAAMAMIACWLTVDGINRSSGFAFLFCFVIGWAVQFIGHLFEGRKPAFTDDFWQIFAAPIFLAVELEKLWKEKIVLRKK